MQPIRTIHSFEVHSGKYSDDRKTWIHSVTQINGAEVEIEIDESIIAQEMARKAFKNKSGVASEVKGGVRVRVLGFTRGPTTQTAHAIDPRFNPGEPFAPRRLAE